MATKKGQYYSFLRQIVLCCVRLFAANLAKKVVRKKKRVEPSHNKIPLKWGKSAKIRDLLVSIF